MLRAFSYSLCEEVEIMSVWVLLIFYYQYGAVAVPIEYPSKEACERAYLIEVKPSTLAWFNFHICMEKKE